MRKFKCEVCSHWHGGFHLCVGPDAPEALKKGDTIYYPNREVMSKADAARIRWADHRENNRARDEKLAKAYEDGMSIREVSKTFDIGIYTVRAAIKNCNVKFRTSSGRNSIVKEQ